jgi:glycosyltransferase involved in cell wall biosynthesis
MHIINLGCLPPPPPGRTGWPWTAESVILPKKQKNGEPWPKISIVTPSFNQTEFIEATIRSVLLQGYPNFEYIIIDGGSTDGSIDIIRRYEPWLTHWISQPDNGQYDAINKGFSHATGEIMAWLNSDDMYYINSFRVVGSVFSQLPVHWITGLPTLWDRDGFTFSILPHPRFKRSLIRFGSYDERGLPSIQQESTFWSKSLWLASGGKLNTEYSFAADFDLWRRFAVKSNLYLINLPLGGFRLHGNQKTAYYLEKYYQEVDRSLSGSRFLSLVNRVSKSRFGRRLLRFFIKISRSQNVISYNPQVQKWEIVTWEMSR